MSLPLTAGCGRNSFLPHIDSANKMKQAVLLILRAYKRFVSPLLPRVCRFEPTCSEYLYQAVDKKGVVKGIALGVRRLLRCHPFCDGGLDPVP